MREENSPIAFMSKIPAICSGPVEQAIRAWALLIKEIKIDWELLKLALFNLL